MIITFDHNNSCLLEEFDDNRKKLIDLHSKKLINNYKVENFDYLEQTAFSIGYKDKKPYLFSTIFRRDWWPIGCYRSHTSASFCWCYHSK